MNVRNYKTVKERRRAVEKELNVDLRNIGSFSLDEAVASARNCENMIGATQVPLGIAGPLRLASGQVQDYFIPLATTEGALVASVNRGCKAITESGGASVATELVGATRGPVFKTTGIKESLALKTWINRHYDDIYHHSKATSSHLELRKIVTSVTGKYVFIRFIFDTKDAMGMNMVTIATETAVTLIERETKIHCVSVAGNFDIDKKPAWLNFIENRGIKVYAEVTLPASVLRDTLKSSASKIYDVWLSKCMIGSAMAGSMGFNAQFANVIAALFLATGQDLGHVGECSMGITTCEVLPTPNAKHITPNSESLYVSVYLPDLMVGTVGGGTGLATQKEALSILGVAGGSPPAGGGKNAQRLAEIIGSAVLAGEISLLASLAEGSLVKAHKKLARGKE